MSASVTALHARLAELDTAIEAQKKVLADLETTRIVVRRQLNGLCDPITQLPLEISSEIFIHCLPTLPTGYCCPDALDAPLLLLHICHSWTNIAISTTALWTSGCLALHFDPNFGVTDKDEYTEFWSRWLSRTGTRPLSLSLSGLATHELAVTVTGHALQMRELRLASPWALTELEVFPDGIMFPALTKLSIRDGRSPYSVVGAVRIFQSSPNLLECTLPTCLVTPENETDVHVVHACLRSLKIGGGSSGRSGKNIMQFLTLPALDSLDISFEGSNVDALIPFLTRSSPPLKRLALDPGNTTWARQTIEHCLGLLSVLTHLELKESVDFQDYVMLILADSRPTLLPDLTHFTIVSSPFTDGDYATLADMISVRRTSSSAVKLQSFRQEWGPYTYAEIPQHVENILQRFIADGMDIRIGRRDSEKNLWA